MSKVLTKKSDSNLTPAWLHKYAEGGSMSGCKDAQGNSIPCFEKPIIPYQSNQGTTSVAKTKVSPIVETPGERMLRTAPKNTATLSPLTKAQFEDSKKSSLSEIATHPMSAIKRVLHKQNLNRGFSQADSNPYDMAVDIVNPVTYAKAAYNTGKSILHPLDTIETLGKAGVNVLTNAVDNVNAFNDNSNQKALGIIGDAAMAGSIGSLTKNTLGVLDKQFSKVGQDLQRIKYEGEANNLSPWEISNNQMSEVGITSNQRQAYRPIISNFLEKNVVPYGYEGFDGSKLKQTFNNIFKQDKSLAKYNEEGKLSDTRDPRREDAWSMYLGKPQEYNTFRMSNTSPINHPSYLPGSLKNKDIYSLNYENELIPNTRVLYRNSIDKNINLLKNKINLNRDAHTMGGYNERLSPDGLQYNDIWDLEPSIVPSKYLPKKLAVKLEDNSLFYKQTENGSIPRSFKIPISKVVGKPFMSHGNINYTWQQHQNNLIEGLTNDIKDYQTIGENMAPYIEKRKATIDQVGKLTYEDGGNIINKSFQDTSKNKQQGWLTKYK